MRAGGAERVTVTLAREIAARGYEVDLLLAQAEGPNLSAVPDSVRLVDLRASRVLYSLPALVRYLRRERPRALLSMMVHTNIVTLWARRLARTSTRVVVSERVGLVWRLENATRRLDSVLPWLIKRFYPWADDIVAVSHGVADELVQFTGIPRAHIQTIYNPVVRPELRDKAQAPVDHPWFRPGEPPVVVGVGRLTAQKDFPSLMRSVAQVRQHRRVRLLILGEGEQRSELEELARELGIEQDVSLPGFEANPYAYMAKAAAYVLSSRWEGLPGVLIEALYCGVPVIATDCPSGPKEILAEGKYGRLVPVTDVGALTQAINMALVDEIPRPPRESWQPFDMEKVVQQYVDVLVAN
jgi:glycosyltransferase involved in cell wall biosynthesis